MVNNKNGEMSWTDASFDPSKKTAFKNDFLRLMPGSNVVRLLTLPHQYYQHKYIIPGGKKYGYRINCSKENGSCPVCEGGDKARRRWFVGVIDRKSSTYKVLDITYTVFKDIQTLARDQDWGDPSGYDVDIVVDQNGGSSGYYTVVAKPPKPLSVADLALKEENTVEEIARRVIPPSPEKVQEKLKNILDEIKAQGGNPEETTSSGAPSDSSDSNDEDEADFFKDHETNKKSPF